MNIRNRPYAIDFTGNNPEYLIRSTPYLTDGQRYAITFGITTITTGTLTIDTPHGTLAYSIHTGGETDELVMNRCMTVDDVYEQLMLKVRYNHWLNTYYIVNVTNNNDHVRLSLTDKEYKTQTSAVTLTSTGDPSEVFVVSTVAGITRVPKEKYKVLVQLESEIGSLTRITPEFYYDDNDMKVSVAMNILKPYFDRRDVPAYMESCEARLCTNAILDSKILFAESENGTVGLVYQDTPVKLIDGKFDYWKMKNNMPDWNTMFNERFSEAEHVDMFGQDHNGTYKIDPGSEQWVYIANFTGVTASCLVWFSIALDNGTSRIHMGEKVTIGQGIYRIPTALSSASESTDGVLSYIVGIRISDYGQGLSQYTLRVNYVMVPRKYTARTMLMVNRLGLYESFVIDDVAKEVATEGDRYVTANSDGYALSDNRTVFTAHTGPRPAKDIRILESSLTKNGNLLLDGEFAFRMFVIPGSFTVLDEREDLMDVEFQFMLFDKINRNPAVVNNIASNSVIMYTDTLIQTT